MTKTQLNQLKLKQPINHSRKLCFGTKEWSENSGICNRCEDKEACGKIKAKLFNN